MLKMELKMKLKMELKMKLNLEQKMELNRDQKPDLFLDLNQDLNQDPIRFLSLVPNLIIMIRLEKIVIMTKLPPETPIMVLVQATKKA